MARQGFDFDAKPSSEFVGDFPLLVTVYESDETTPRPNVPIKLTDLSTKESITRTVDSNGQHTFILGNDLENFRIGDLIQVEEVSDDMEYYISANGDESNPSWIEVDNEVETKVYPNSAVIKQNSSEYGGGREVNLTLN